MRAVLMAAGVGSRISREVRKPKSLLDIGNGELLLHYTVKMLKRHGLDVTIVVEYGSPVPDVAHNIQENVKKAIETMSGLDVRNVDVHVQGVSFERENQAAAELDEQQKKLYLVK